MSEAQLKKVEDERDRLQSELEFMRNACTASEACQRIIEFVSKEKDPLDPTYDGPDANPWRQPGNDGGCQCLVQ